MLIVNNIRRNKSNFVGRSFFFLLSLRFSLIKFQVIELPETWSCWQNENKQRITSEILFYVSNIRRRENRFPFMNFRDIYYLRKLSTIPGKMSYMKFVRILLMINALAYVIIRQFRDDQYLIVSAKRIPKCMVFVRCLSIHIGGD